MGAVAGPEVIARTFAGSKPREAKSLFINIQHPGEGGTVPPAAPNTTTSDWPDRRQPARSSTIVITKDDGGIIGT